MRQGKDSDIEWDGRIGVVTAGNMWGDEEDEWRWLSIFLKYTPVAAMRPELEDENRCFG